MQVLIYKLEVIYWFSCSHRFYVPYDMSLFTNSFYETCDIQKTVVHQTVENCVFLEPVVDHRIFLVFLRFKNSGFFTE